MSSYGYILIFAAIAFFMGAVGIAFSYLFAPKKQYLNKNEPYECGFSPKSKNFTPFNVRYYLIAVLFVVFDVEIVLLIPFVIAFKSLSVLGLAAGITLLLLLIIGFVYEVKKGVLDWQ